MASGHPEKTGSNPVQGSLYGRHNEAWIESFLRKPTVCKALAGVAACEL